MKSRLTFRITITPMIYRMVWSRNHHDPQSNRAVEGALRDRGLTV